MLRGLDLQLVRMLLDLSLLLVLLQWMDLILVLDLSLYPDLWLAYEGLDLDLEHPEHMDGTSSDSSFRESQSL
jgi:hypothetical protein